jgi:hypothetical protein
MGTERQKLLELNAQRQVEAFARKQARHADNEASRQRMAARAQRWRQAPATPATMLHRQMSKGQEAGTDVGGEGEEQRQDRPVARPNQRPVD